MSTSSWLASSAHGEVVFVATIEGIKYCLTTASGACLSTATTGLNALYVADGYAAALSGLGVVGEYSQSISAFEPTGTGSTVELRYHDLLGLLGPYLFAPRSAARTWLTAPVDANDTTASAVTDGFAASGDLYVGREAIQYAALDADSFNTLTRGAYSDGRDSDGDRLGSDHDYVTTGDVTGPQLSPGVASRPIVLPGRIVSIYAHQVTRGLPCAIADRACLFRGYLDEVTRQSSGELRFRVGHLQRVLDTQILRSQFVGNPSRTWTTTVPQTVTVAIVGTASDYETSTTIAAGTYEGWQGVMSALSTALATCSGTVSGHKFSINTCAVGDETRVALTFTKGSYLGAGAYPVVVLSPWLAEVLGFAETGVSPHVATLQTTGDFLYTSTGGLRPLLYIATSNSTLTVDRVAGRWISQSTSRLPAAVAFGTNGFLSQGEVVWQVQYVSEASDVLTFQFFFADANWGGSSDAPSLAQAREGDALPELRQVWIERTGLMDWLYRTLLSTGCAGQNVATYDDRAASLGAGLPYNYLDAASFLGAEDPEVVVQITGPTTIAKIVEPLLAASGRYLILDAGVLKAITLPWDATFGSYQALAAADYCGTDATAYPEMAWGRDGVINRVKIKTGLKWLVRETEVTVNDVSSMGCHGPQPGPTLEAPGLVDLRAWAEQIAEPMVAYFARGPQRLGLSVGWTCSQLVPGDKVALTDVSMLDPATGLAGVTSMAAVVCSSSFDCSSGRGRLELWYLAEKAGKGGYWAPTARVSTYTAGDPSITVAEHTYSAASESADDADFTLGDVVLIHSIDASGALQTWERTLAAVDHGTRKLTLSGVCLGLDTSTRTYDVTFASVTSSTADQYADHAYEADATGVSTGGTVPAPYTWMASQDALARTAPADVGLVTLPATVQGLAVSAGSCHLAAGVLDRIAQKRMRSLLASSSFGTAYSNAVATTSTVHLYWMALPLYLPAYAETWGSITVSMAVKADAVSTVFMVTPVLCRRLPTGSGPDAGEYYLGRHVDGTTVEVDATSYTIYSSDIPSASLSTGLWYLVLVAEQTEGAATTLSMRDLSVWGA